MSSRVTRYQAAADDYDDGSPGPSYPNSPRHGAHFRYGMSLLSAVEAVAGVVFESKNFRDDIVRVCVFVAASAL